MYKLVLSEINETQMFTFSLLFFVSLGGPLQNPKVYSWKKNKKEEFIIWWSSNGGGPIPHSIQLRTNEFEFSRNSLAFCFILDTFWIMSKIFF